MYKGLLGEHYKGDYGVEKKVGEMEALGPLKIWEYVGGRNITRMENLQNKMGKNMKNANEKEHDECMETGILRAPLQRHECFWGSIVGHWGLAR